MTTQPQEEWEEEFLRMNGESLHFLEAEYASAHTKKVGIGLSTFGHYK